jgi:putative ABC transport system permease protein
MYAIAIKMLMGDRLKYFGLLAGMSFAAMMIAQQASIFVGLISQTGTFIRGLPYVDLWVMDEQVRFSEDQQPIPETALPRIRSIEGVEWAVPMFKGWLPARLPDGTRLNAIVVGIDDATLVGGPLAMKEGRLEDLRRDGAVLIHHKEASTKLKQDKRGGAPLKVGDRISINDQDAFVAGTFDSDPSFFWDPVMYTTYSRALRFSPRQRNLMHYVLVRLRPGTDVEAVRARIQDSTPYKALTRPEFIALTRDFIAEKTGILINFGIAIGLGFCVGMLITGQTFFNFTLDNLRYFGALKAMGTSSWMLVKMVMLQVMVAATFSLGIGLGVASLMGLQLKETDLAFLMPWQVPVLTAGSLLFISMLAGGLSLVKVLRLEPGVVFKG